jgi:hypothetical protein
VCTNGLLLHCSVDKKSVLIGSVFIVSGRKVCDILMKGAFNSTQYTVYSTQTVLLSCSFSLNKCVTKYRCVALLWPHIRRVWRDNAVFSAIGKGKVRPKTGHDGPEGK